MKKMDKLAVFLIPIGVAVNFIGAQIAMLLKLPVYLDGGCKKSCVFGK